MRPLLLVCILPLFCAGADYRVDCAGGKSLDEANQIRLQPGDRLLLHSGCRWTGTLMPQGSGTSLKPVVIDRYGEGALPRIDGNGAEEALLLRDQEYIEVRNLELTNDAPEPGLRRGLLYRAGSLGRVFHHIHLAGLEIHNVKGKPGSEMVEKLTGGIGFEVDTKGKGARLDDVLIENNHIYAVDNIGIYLYSESIPNPRSERWAELHHTGVVVKGNRLEDIGKNAMCIRSSLAPVIAHNTITGAAARLHGNAIYVFATKDARIEFNEVSGTQYHGNEGAAYDSDYSSEGTIIQYNYSHDNGGGLANICANPASKTGFNDGTIIRYNVSRNEGERVIAFDGPATNTQIYNNTIYVPKGTHPHILEFDLFGKEPGYADRTWYTNNIVMNEGNGVYLPGEATNSFFDHNCFFGNHPANEPDDAAKVRDEPLFESMTAGAGGFRLKAGSPCAGTGTSVQQNGGRDFSGTLLPRRNPDRGALQTPAFDVVTKVVYGSPGGHELLADLYLPRGTGPFPAAVYIHGGAWSSGDRSQLRRQAARMASLGIAGMAIEYRLAPEFKYPAAIYDSKAAVRWLRTNAAKYHIDGGQIAVVGSSAGGHLAAFLGVTGNDPKWEGDVCCLGVSSAVQAVVAFNPIVDLYQHKDASNAKFLGSTCAELPARCKEASPTNYVDGTLPPFLILHGTADQTAPYQQSAVMTAKMKAAGVRAELFSAEGAPHTFWAEDRWLEPSFAAMEKFLMDVFHDRSPQDKK